MLRRLVCALNLSIFLALLPTLPTLPARAGETGEAWTMTAGVNPSLPLSYCSMFAFDNRLWLTGWSDYPPGFVSCSSPDGHEWRKLPPPAAVSAWPRGTSFVSFQDQILAIAGADDGADETAPCRIWKSGDGETWSTVTASAPLPGRWGGHYASFGGRLWALGGSLNVWTDTITARKDVWWSSDGANWTCATQTAPWGPRGGFAVCADSSALWLMGGYGIGDNATKNDVWRSTDGAVWTTVTAHANWNRRSGHAALSFAGKLWVVGGNGPENVSMYGYREVWSSEDGANWTRSAQLAPRRRSSILPDAPALTTNSSSMLLTASGHRRMGFSSRSAKDQPPGLRAPATLPSCIRTRYG